GVPLGFTVAQQQDLGHRESLADTQRVSGTCAGIVTFVAVLRLFAAAREAAGTGRAEIDGATVGEVLERARVQFGPDLERVIQRCRVWLNGEPAADDTPVQATDEVAVLPPVSGG